MAFKKVFFATLVVYKPEFDAESRGRSVHIVFHRKVISQKNKNADAKIHLHEKSRWLLNFSSTYISNEGYRGKKLIL